MLATLAHHLETRPLFPLSQEQFWNLPFFFFFFCYADRALS